MAKMFYTLEETMTALGKSEEELKQLNREGRLREFRDGQRHMYKADQVEQLKAELGGGAGPAPEPTVGAEPTEQLDVSISDSGLPIGLAESGGSGTGLSLADADTDVGRASPAPAAAQGAKEDTALAADLGLSGLSGSLGGVPSPGRVGSALSGTGVGSAQGTRAGINVFGTDEMPAVDPSAQTAISSGVRDQVNLESVGSGSGLLDLTRESDDTSLGAELLDEISPGASKKGSSSGDTAVAPAVDVTAGEPRPATARAIGAPMYVEKPDPSAEGFGFMAAGATVTIFLGALVLVSALCDTDALRMFRDSKQPFLFVSLVGVILSAVFFVVGMVIGKLAKR
jgi:hypothetical protein